ncbi:c-type cytochrome [Flavihumibacter stibioxidans]|uniref:Cytochrome c domain-containing protein n=1 Tax=Flavihumibacter stibioxidans TaxID=1834163 RepID=A0ABR7MB08_9BACT|nr:c-type cytochrome [Flavihumibacter stibioxidans]MBC6492131.1 hypothetical protein [Flavihumibacter stibioxidans]
MKKIIAGITAIAAIAAFTIAGCKNSTAKVTDIKVDTSQATLIKRGEYLVTTMVCEDCHSPKRMGPNGPEIIPELRFSGHPAEAPLPAFDSNEVKNGWVLFSPDLTAAIGPWGASYAGNLTSDGSGIGNWTFQQFKTALTKGKLKGLETNRNILPPMPWQNFAKLPEEDMKAIFTFLKSTRPVSNIVPAPKTFAELANK